MTKEQFIVDALFLLYKKPRVPLKRMNYTAYGISRVTAWRVLRNLRQARIVEGDWSLTERFRNELKELMCGNCPHPRIAQEKHREQTKKMLEKALHPNHFK